MKRNKKGLGLNQLAPAVLVLLIAGIIASIGQSITSNVRDNIYEENSNNATYAYNASTQSLQGVDEIASWFDTIGLVIAAVVIIGVVGLFGYMKRR